MPGFFRAILAILPVVSLLIVIAAARDLDVAERRMTNAERLTRGLPPKRPIVRQPGECYHTNTRLRFGLSLCYRLRATSRSQYVCQQLVNQHDIIKLFCIFHAVPAARPMHCYGLHCVFWTRISRC